MSIFQEGKMALVHTFGLAKDALHVHVGLAIFIIAALLMRRSISDWRPLAVVLAAAVAGEVWDFIDRLQWSRVPLWDDHRHDLWNTMLWPALLFLLARYTRVLKR